MFFFDPTMILLIPPLILMFWAQSKVKGSYKKYSQISSSSGMTGYQIARMILNKHGLNNIDIEPVSGELTDHYDLRKRKVFLSESIYNETSIASLGIAAHEVGHAIQHAKSYTPLTLRNALLKPASIGSNLAFPIFIVGMIFTSFSFLMTWGILLFSAALVFQLVTLPVEFDASRKALVNLRESGIVAESEVDQAKKVLSAAALTYVAAATMTLTHLLRMIILRNYSD